MGRSVQQHSDIGKQEVSAGVNRIEESNASFHILFGQLEHGEAVKIDDEATDGDVES